MEPVVFFVDHYIHYNHRTMPFISILFLNFHIIIMWSKKKKGNRCHLININSKKVNSNFSLLVSKVCANLICSGGICPRGYMSHGVYVPRGICDSTQEKDAPMWDF